MTSFEFKYRDGRLVLWISQNGNTRVVKTPYCVSPREWNPATRRLVIPYDNSIHTKKLVEIEDAIIMDTRRMEYVIRKLERERAKAVKEAQTNTPIVGTRRGRPPHIVRPVSVDDIATRYKAVSRENSLGAYVETVAEELIAAGSPELAKTYGRAYAGLLRFVGGTDITFDQLSRHLFTDYEDHIKAKGHTLSYSSFSLRGLRAIYNRAVVDGFAPNRADSLFEFVCTDIIVAQTPKESISTEEFHTIASQLGSKNLPNNLAQALAMFMFCYHARGMDFADLAHLKKKDLRGDVLSFRERDTDRLVEMPVTADMRRIIDWFSPKMAFSSWLFPVLTDSEGDLQAQYETGLRLQNQRLSKLATKCGISKSISIDDARRFHESVGHESVTAKTPV